MTNKITLSQEVAAHLEANRMYVAEKEEEGPLKTVSLELMHDLDMRVVSKIQKFEDRLEHIKTCVREYTDPRMLFAYLLGFLEIEGASVESVPIHTCPYCQTVSGGLMVGVKPK